MLLFREATTAFIHELRTRTQSEREMFASLQQELKRIARAKMRREWPGHTLQTTTLGAFILGATKWPSRVGAPRPGELRGSLPPLDANLKKG